MVHLFNKDSLEYIAKAVSVVSTQKPSKDVGDLFFMGAVVHDSEYIESLD